MGVKITEKNGGMVSGILRATARVAIAILFLAIVVVAFLILR
jgi:hypothetical protein